jgi:hypothetical protein
MEFIDKFAHDLQSGYWWITVVLVGFVINILSAYLKSPIDRIISSFSSVRRLRNEQRSARIEDESNELVNDLQLFNLEVNLQTRDLVLSLELLALAATLGFMFIVLAPFTASESIPKFILGIALAILALVIYIFANVLSLRATEKLEVISIANRKLRRRREA